MPQNTIQVNLISDSVIFNKDNYFSPLLIFKAKRIRSTLLSLTGKVILNI